MKKPDPVKLKQRDSLLRTVTAHEYQLGLLAACWGDQDNAKLVLGTMAEEDFSGSARMQFQVLSECWKRYRSADLFSAKKVSSELSEEYVAAYDLVLKEFMGGDWAGCGPGQVRTLMQQVTEESSRQRFLDALKRAPSLMEDCATLEEARAKVSASLTKAAGHQKQSAEHWETGLGKLAEEVRARLAAEAAGQDAPGRMMSTGIDTVDDILGGIEESDYVVVAARTGVGKTAFSLCVATHLAANYGSVLFCSLELSRPKVWRRVAVQQSQMPLKTVERRPDLIDAARAANTNLWIDDSPLRPGQLQQRIELFRLEYPDLCCVFIDHLGIFAEPPRMFEQTSAASNAVRDAMKATGVPIVAAVQIGRKAELREGSRPTSGDLRMSGDIEQDARKIILLHRPPLYRPAGQGDPFEAVAIVAKNGEGETGDAALRYNGQLFTFLPGYTQPSPDRAPNFPTHNPPQFEDLGEVDLDF